jgi:DNA-binding CsgD family transcriptional regulator
VTDLCAAGHAQTPGNTYSGGPGQPRRCAPCKRAEAWARYEARHAGHDIATISGHTMDGHPRRRCTTCHGQPHAYTPPEADDSAVQRAVMGDPPPRLNVSERRAAVQKLRGELSGRLIAERIGVSPRTVWRHLAAARTGVAA